MANYRAVSGGNWSQLARWQDDAGGSYVNSTVLPGVNDVVYANNFSVTIDINIAVNQLRTTTGPSATAGGNFDFGAGTTVIANVFSATTVCLRNFTGVTKNLIGNAFAGSGQAALQVGSGFLNITGNLTGGGGFGVAAVIGPENCSITGNVIGGTHAPAIIVSSGTCNINGVAIGSDFANVGGAEVSSTGTVNVTTAQGGLTAAGIIRTGGAAVIDNAFYGPTGMSPTQGIVVFRNAASPSVRVTRQNLTTTTLVDPTTGFPAVGNVRQGTTYASGTLTGTLAVPPAGAVSLGVPVDNTTGTATLSAQDIFTAIANSADPIAVRLRNVSTVATTAATVAAFDV
jgi:hypothetical protein